MFGVKTKRVQTRRAYSMESFYAAIRDKTFTAGEPSLTKHGLAEIVTFPALDGRNQVQILPLGLPQTRQFQIRKANAFGFGKTARRCAELVEITAKELEMIHL